MVSKKDILEIKRRFKKEECTVRRICGCYVDSSRTKVTSFSESFLNLEDEEFYKYLDILKKIYSGNLGNNILELPFPREAEEGGMQQFFMGLRESELNNEELCDRLYDQIIEHYDYVGNYLILLFYDVYDVPLKTTDNMKLDESEEMFPYISAAICPVNLSKPGLGYLAEDNKIGPRIRDWVVDMPDVGFMFPSFAERSADVHSLTYYVKDAKDSKRQFVQTALGAGAKRTETEQRMTVHAIIKRAVAPITGDDNDELILNIQENLQEKITSYEENTGEEIKDEESVLTADMLTQVLEENAIPSAITAQIKTEFNDVFDNAELPTISTVIDEKKLDAALKQKKEEELTSQVAELKNELVNKTFEAVAKADAPMDTESGFSQTYDVILRVKPDKVPQIHTDNVDGRRCVVIPLAEGEYVNLNGINTKL